MKRRTLTALLTGLFLLSGNADAKGWVAHSTSYCLKGRMADSTSTRTGSVASNRHPLGTKLYVVSESFFGQRRFVVRDRIGWGSELDFWASSCMKSYRWGRRTVTYRIGWPRYHAKVRKKVMYGAHVTGRRPV